MNTQANTEFDNLDYGTTVTTGKTQKVTAEVNPDIMIGEYASEYLNRLQRANPTRFKSIDITLQELQSYFSGLVAIRIDSVNDKCTVWREAKALNIPTWMQFTISRIGKVVDLDHGVIIEPAYTGEAYDINQMLETSAKLEYFKNDGFRMFKDAFPRDKEGDAQVMTFTIEDNVVKTCDRLAHPVKSYVAAFIGIKLRNYMGALALNVTYDDMSFISTMLLHDEVIYK